MKTKVLRLSSAVLLMGIALAACIAVILSFGQWKEERGIGKASLSFRTGSENTRIRLYNEEGRLLQELYTDATGQANSKPLAAGLYLAESDTVQVQIRLHEDHAVCVLEGSGSFDGSQIRLGEENGSLELLRPSRGTSLFLAYRLTGENFDAQELLYDDPTETLLRLRFEELPYGSYILTESGLFCCRITISESSPHIILSLP